MEKTKAYFITAIIVILFGSVVWLLWNNAIRSYWVMCQMIALYGFVRGAIDLGRWIARPTQARALPKAKSPADYTKNGWEV